MRLSKIRRAAIGGVSIAALIGLAGCGQAIMTGLNQLDLTEFQVDGSRLFINGTINAQTLDEFEAIYAQNPNIDTLVELEVDGSIDDDTMIAFAYRVRQLGLDTHRTATSEIYSGGVDLFLAGAERTMEQGAVIGVHSWADGDRDAFEYPRSSPEHEQNRKYVEDMLGNDAFYWFTIYAAPADGMHIMTRQEIEQFRLLTTP